MAQVKREPSWPEHERCELLDGAAYLMASRIAASG